MDRSPYPDDFPENWRRFFNDAVFDQATGLPIILESAPTTAGGELQEGQRGYYNGNVYETIDGVTYKYTVVST